ncbi:MAG: hypothetical protein EXX96DRAFT_568621 [Benjaminiella poitrasii]|nr:MAG: hypothetical protein EXX96DRAFT_568621 [Benjaminiella poitrasii]
MNRNNSQFTQAQYHQFRKPESSAVPRSQQQQQQQQPQQQQQRLEYDLVRHHIDQTKMAYGSHTRPKPVHTPFANHNSNSQSSNIMSRPEPPKAVTAITRSFNPENIKLSPTEIMNRKKLFATFTFYLDNLESSIEQKIERGIKLLGARREAFFSNKCTHLITNKVIPSQPNMLQRDYMQKITAKTDNNETAATKTLTEGSNTQRDTLVENALQWNIVLWSAEVMVKTLEYFVKVNINRREIRDKRPLDKALQEEKMYGPSTGAQHTIQAKKPVFVPFTGHYIVVEDLEQLYRPPICKQLTKELYTKDNKPSEYPWPYIKPTPKHRSPFGRKSRSTKDDADKDQVENLNVKEAQPSVHHQQQRHPKQTQKSLYSTEKLVVVGREFTPFDTTTNVPMTTNTTTATPTTTVTTTALGDGAKNESKDVSVVKRLGKRMFETVEQSEQQQQSQQQQSQHQQKKQKQQAPQKKKQKIEERGEAHYCENCNVTFQDHKEHVLQEMHQAFIKDQHNFTKLDTVIESVRRVYRAPLPTHLRNHVDPNLDGDNVQFSSPPSHSKPLLL